MPNVIGAELNLIAFLRSAGGHGHDAGIVD
jgi:hypothetical protein